VGCVELAERSAGIKFDAVQIYSGQSAVAWRPDFCLRLATRYLPIEIIAVHRLFAPFRGRKRATETMEGK
jgi:hypothetical protein